MDNNNTDYKYIAKNILNNSDAAITCENDVRTSMPAASFRRELQAMRITRHIAFDMYINRLADTTENTEMTLILEELASCIPAFKSRSIMNSNAGENVISLELTSCVEAFARTLSLRDRNVFIRRYFFAESIPDIAFKYHLSQNCVRKIINDCCSRLKTIFTEKKYRFKAETLFYSFTDINEVLLNEQSRENASVETKLKRAVTIVGSLSLVACIALILIIALKPTVPKTTEANDIGATVEKPQSLQELAESEFITDDYVNTEALLGYTADLGYSFYGMTKVQYGSYTLVYESYELMNNNILKYLTSGWTLNNDSYYQFSEPNDPTSEWYELKGHGDMQYLVKKSEGEYSLWKFSYVKCDTTNTESFDYLMSSIYDIYDEGDIVKIIATPASIAMNSDNYDVSFAEISISTYAELSYIYYVMSNMICYGDGNWDLISDYPAHDFSEITDDAMQLTIITPEGEVIDRFYYSDMAGCFYEDTNGVAYSKVSDNAKKKLREIFYSELDGITSYNYTLKANGINSAEDISCISLQTIAEIDGQIYFDMIRDSDTIKQIYVILSDMAISPSGVFDESESVYGAMSYQLYIFNSEGVSVCSPTYHATYKSFSEGDIIYDTLSIEECSFFNKLGADYLTPTEE